MESLPRQESLAFQGLQRLTPFTLSGVRLFLAGSDGCSDASSAQVEEFGIVNAAGRGPHVQGGTRRS